jgi:hypothetical protein
MQKWEYTCCSITEASLVYTDLVNHLNKLGQEGWELTGIANPLGTSEGLIGHTINNQLTYWLKRPIE